MRFLTLVQKRFGLARLLLFTSLLAVSTLTCGCVYALRPSNQPYLEKLRVQALTPQQYSIRVAEKVDYPVPSDGRVIVQIPVLDHGCATYLFGVIKVKDSSPKDVRAIKLERDDHVIKKLSLNDLGKLPIDDEGYRLVKVR